MANQTGIAIVIKAFLPTGKTLDEQFAALSLVKDAHANGDYSKVLAAAHIDEVKAEQKTRRVDDQPLVQPEAAKADDQPEATNWSEPSAPPPDVVLAQPEDSTEDVAGADEVPTFLKKGRKSAA